MNGQGQDRDEAAPARPSAPMVTARLEPMPPNAVPVSKPASASNVDPTSRR